jgi:hypothetical protein
MGLTMGLGEYGVGLAIRLRQTDCPGVVGHELRDLFLFLFLPLILHLFLGISV